MTNYPDQPFNNFKAPPGSSKYLLIALFGIAVILVVFSSVGVVGAGYRGVMLRFGAVTGRIVNEGLYFKVPFIEEVVPMSTQIQKYTTQTTASSKDLQVVTTEVTLNYQLDQNDVATIYRNLRQDYEQRIIQPF